jgi:hypothetical protein
MSPLFLVNLVKLLIINSLTKLTNSFTNQLFIQMRLLVLNQ